MDALVVQRLCTSNPELCNDQAYALVAVSLSFCGACDALGSSRIDELRNVSDTDVLVFNNYGMKMPEVVFYDEERNLLKTAEVIADAFSFLSGTEIPVKPLRGDLLDQNVSSAVHVCPPDCQTDYPPRFEFVDAHRRKAMSLRSDGDCYSGIAVTGKITDKIVALTKRWLGQLIKEKGDL